jgi:glyoxylase-like metal-dependent hydrolase (beta-lactamase superfamily II)
MGQAQQVPPDHARQPVDNLKGASYPPERVDAIYITHMRADHVGGSWLGCPNASEPRSEW